MTVKQNISYVPNLLNKKDKKKNEDAVYKWMKIVGLDEELKERYPFELSGGQQQRVGIARALAASPNILLMDEPFGALDPITRDALQEMIKGLQQEMKKTIVFVTHDMDEAIKLADKIIIMDHGELVQYDEVETILEHPANDFVEELIGKRKRNSYYNNEMTVADLMVKRVEAISISKSITDAIRQMSEKKVDTLLVVDDQRCLKGFVDINFICLLYTSPSPRDCS